MSLFKIIPLLCLSTFCTASEINIIDKFYGTYGDNHKKLIIYPGNKDSVVVYIDKNGGPPNYSGSNLFGKATLKGGVLHHASLRFNSSDYPCEFTISLKDNLATITTLTSDSKCGFNRYTLGDTFVRSSDTPQKEVENIFTGGVCALEFLAKQLRETNKFMLTGCYKG